MRTKIHTVSIRNSSGNQNPAILEFELSLIVASSNSCLGKRWRKIYNIYMTSFYDDAYQKDISRRKKRTALARMTLRLFRDVYLFVSSRSYDIAGVKEAVRAEREGDAVKFLKANNIENGNWGMDRMPSSMWRLRHQKIILLQQFSPGSVGFPSHSDAFGSPFEIWERKIKTSSLFRGIQSERKCRQQMYLHRLEKRTAIFDFEEKSFEFSQDLHILPPMPQSWMKTAKIVRPGSQRYPWKSTKYPRTVVLCLQIDKRASLPREEPSHLMLPPAGPSLSGNLLEFHSIGMTISAFFTGL